MITKQTSLEVYYVFCVTDHLNGQFVMRIKFQTILINNGDLCKGSTTAFDAVRWGSNPQSPAKGFISPSYEWRPWRGICTTKTNDIVTWCTHSHIYAPIVQEGRTPDSLIRRVAGSRPVGSDQLFFHCFETIKSPNGVGQGTSQGVATLLRCSTKHLGR